MNNFFCINLSWICKPEDALPYIPGERVGTNFDFMPPEIYGIMLFAEEIYVDSSSGFIGLNASICKIILLHIHEKMRMIFANSMFSGIFRQM